MWVSVDWHYPCVPGYVCMYVTPHQGIPQTVMHDIHVGRGSPSQIDVSSTANDLQ